MAYDGTANDVVVFGGRNNGSVLNDTWTFNGTTWAQQTPYASPVALSDASMAYDAQLGGNVLFGGSNSSGVRQNTIYYWNQTSGTWEVVENNTTPSARADTVMAPAAVNSSTASAGANGQLVLLGGTTTGGTTVGDTQIFDWGHNGSNTGDATYSLPVGDQTNVSVDLGTGNLYMSTKTYNIAGTGINSSNTAGYNSQGASTTNSIVASLSALPNGSILVNGLNGAYGTTIFTKSGSSFAAPSGTEATLTYCPAVSGPICVTASTYVLTENSSQTSYTFTSTGTMQLTTITDRNGNTIQITPTGSAPTTITDTHGRTVTNAYTSGGGTQSETFTDNSLAGGRSWVESSPTGDANYTQLTDPTSANTYFTYNPAGDLTKIVDPDGNVRLFGYDVNGRVASVTQVTNVAAGTGPTTMFTWQAITAGATPPPPATAADEVVVTNFRGDATTYVDGYGGQALQVIDADGHYRASTYNVDRQPTTLADALQNMTTNTFTAGTNNLTETKSPPSKTGATPQVSYFSYETPSMTSGSSPVPITGYKYLPSSSVDATGNCTAYAYNDGAGNLTSVRVGLTATGTPPNCDGVTSGGYVTTYAYQGDPGVASCGAKTGELCTATSPGLAVTSYGYSTNGSLTSITQPGGTCTGTVTLCTTYTYDGASRLKTMTNGNGQVTTYSYDGDDRTVQVLSNGATTCTYSSGNCVFYTYSPAGNLDTQQDSYGTITYGYDDLDRLITQKLPANANGCADPPMGETGIIYSYDAANNVAGYCDAGGTDNYTYDAANNLTGVATEGGSCTPGAVIQPCTTYSRDNNNRVTKTVWPTSTGAQQCDGYDNAGNLINQVATAGTCTDGTAGAVAHTGTAYDDLSYTYQLPGNIDQPLLQSVKDNTTAITTAYTYNTREDLIGATPTSGTSYGYSYGVNGNLTQQATNGTATLAEAQMPTGQLCWTLPSSSSNGCASPPSGSTTYNYDNSGNETGNNPPTGTSETLSYNPLAQTTAMTAAGTSTTLDMSYTGTGSTDRTADGTITLTNNAYGIASTTANSGTYFTYNPGATPDTLASLLVGGTSGTGARYYYLYDDTGNVIGLIDSNGNSVATYSYTPYGKLTSSGTDPYINPFRYQGGYHDSTNFDKFGDRYYNPTTGIWTQPDPKTPNINNPATYLTYSFDSNDPINNTDPTGADSYADSCVSGATQGVAIGALGEDETGVGLVAAAGEGCVSDVVGDLAQQYLGPVVGDATQALGLAGDASEVVSDVATDLADAI